MMQPMVRREVLVITTDPVTERMPGPAIRAWHLAEVLACHHRVTLVSAVAADRSHPAMEVRFASVPEVEELARRADVVIGPGSVVRRYPGVAASEVPLVIDIYDPYHLENLEPDGTSDAVARRDNIRHLTAVVNEDLARGDFFLCASARQRDFWLGSLAATGRVNASTYDDDPLLERLITVVPFGLSPTGPTRRGPGLRERFAGIGPDDPVLVWGGGVYNWLDPASLVRAVDRARGQVPDLRLVFLGMRNPNPDIPEMRVAADVRALADELGISGTHVFFMDGWVPYDDRADFLLDADIGVSTHLDHVETRFSFRTRILDYLWAGLPMVLTGGDPLAELVEEAGAGITVPAGDVEALAAAIAAVLAHPPGPEVVAALAGRFAWEHVAAPLVAFCDDPRRAPDRSAGEIVTPEIRAAPPEPGAPGPPPPEPLSDAVRRDLGRLARGARRRRSPGPGGR
jgi:glycosyltransferase involved in cell wall biosynthesis